MSLFKKKTSTQTTDHPVVVSESQLLVMNGRVYKAELFGLIEVPVETLEQQAEKRRLENEDTE